MTGLCVEILKMRSLGMSRFPKSLGVGFFCLALSFLFTHQNQLSAYVSIPRSTADTTDRMNAGGDPPDRLGLQDEQRSPEFLDDVWGENDYYYSQYGIRETGGAIKDPIYDSENPPYYPYPNTYYNKDPALRNYDTNTRYYRPGYPR